MVISSRWSELFAQVESLALRKKNGSCKGERRGVVFVTGERNQRNGITRAREETVPLLVGSGQVLSHGVFQTDRKWDGSRTSGFTNRGSGH